MRKLSALTLLLVAGLLLVFLSGCTSDNKSGDSSTSDSGSASAQSESIEAPSNTSDSSNASADTSADANTSTASAPQGSESSDSQEETPTSYEVPIPEETQKTMDNLTGTWLSQTALADGSVSVVRVKIDNVSGFTFTTGTVNPDGSESYYSRIGSYEIEGNAITFFATTGGEHQNIDDYNLKTGMDPGVYTYTFEENPELTTLVLTPTNELATQLTGAAPITLAKS